MKFQSVQPWTESLIIALSEDGEIFVGNFRDGNNFKVPKILWRRLPSPPKNALCFENKKELTPEELNALEQKAIAEKLKTHTPDGRPRPLPIMSSLPTKESVEASMRKNLRPSFFKRWLSKGCDNHDV